MKNVNIVYHIIGDKIRTCKVKDYSVLSGTWLPISAHLLKKTARDKTWTYNLNIFSVPLYQIELLELNKKFLEILGFDPKITICKIAVLPIKLYSLNYYTNPYPKNDLNVYDLHQ